MADGAEKRPQRGGHEKGIDQREWYPRPSRIPDQTEVRVEDVDHVLARREADRGGAHVDDPVDRLVERRIVAHATGDHDVFHDFLVERRERDEGEEQERPEKKRSVTLSAVDRRSEEVGDEDVHAGGPRTGSQAPEEEPCDKALRLRLVPIASVDEYKPHEGRNERSDERQQ